MKKIVFFAGLVLLVACANRQSATNAGCDKKQPVNLILDTDLGPDYDDVGAMAVMHALADSGQVNILATLASNSDWRVVPCIEVLNAYFGRPDIPVGAPKGVDAPSLTSGHRTKWTEALPARYPHHTASTADAPDAVKLYRQVLSAQPDSSVVICTIGFFTNLKGLLLSEADEYSPLDGRELVARKVRRLVSMAGEFPAGREYNVYCDVQASAAVAEQWPTEIVFSGFEIGLPVLTGKRLIASPVENSPVKDAYALCMSEGDPNGRNSWDQTAVLAAIKGYASYFDAERGRFFLTDETGANGWQPDEHGPHVRLVQKLQPDTLATLLEGYMMHQPVCNRK